MVKIVRGLDSGELRQAPSVALTMGVFDGVHLGHRKVIETVVSGARRMGGASALLTFQPHPRQVIGADEPLLMLTSLVQRIGLLDETGLDACIVLPFDRETAGEDASTFFVKRLLPAMLLRLVCIGPQFTFGARKSGDAELLRELGRVHGFAVEVIEGVTIDGIAVSSTTIRDMVRQGDVESASRLLGRPYSICGVVVRGKALGREFGIPTANVSVEGVLLPPPGVYVARISRGGRRYDGVLNVDFHGGVEVHIFSLQESLYGETIEIVVGKFLREERKFESEEELAAQMRCDIEIAKGIRHNNAVPGDKL
jgi:riboflavin kinase/FMN adenylyltransferase